MDQGKPPKGGSSVAPMLPRGGSTDLPQPTQPTIPIYDKITNGIKRIESYLKSLRLFAPIYINDLKQTAFGFDKIGYGRSGKAWRLVVRDDEDNMTPLLESPFTLKLRFADKVANKMIVQALEAVKKQQEVAGDVAEVFEKMLAEMNVPELDPPGE